MSVPWPENIQNCRELAKQLQIYRTGLYVIGMHRVFIPAKQLVLIVLSAVVLIILIMVGARCWILADTSKSIYRNAETLPKQRVGLVLGCAQNLYFYARIEATCTLFNAGKIDFILVSGDNHKATYDEASSMKQVLVNEGIPADRIFCDYAGFSTFDSIVRAKKVFNLHQVTIISQEFHIRRALFIAKRKQLDAIGFCAADVETTMRSPTIIRETFARVKTILDLYLLPRKPVDLGDTVIIGPIETAEPTLLKNNKA